MSNLPRFAEARRDSHRVKIDDEGLCLSLELPGPSALAEWAAPAIAEVGDWRRLGGTVYRGGVAADLDDLAAAIRSALAALPDVPDTRPCRDLARSLAFPRSPRLRAYWQEVARATRSRLREPAREPRDREPGRAPAERMAAKRRSDREAEVESARWSIGLWAHPDNERAPGGKVAAPTLYAEAVEPVAEVVEEFSAIVENYYKQGMSRAAALDAWAEDAEAEGWPSRPRVPGPRVFREAASAIFGSPRRSNGRDYYAVTREALDHLAPKD